jgi:hypothetical protein
VLNNQDDIIWESWRNGRQSDNDREGIKILSPFSAVSCNATPFIALNNL